MGQTALLPFRRKVCWGFFSPWKIRRLRPGLNTRTWVPKASTLPLDHRSRWAIYDQTCILVFMWNISYFWQILTKLEFSRQMLQISEIWNLIEIRQVGAEYLQEDGRTDRHYVPNSRFLLFSHKQPKKNQHKFLLFFQRLQSSFGRRRKTFCSEQL